MKYYIIAGERSGDLHASNLIKEIKKKDDNAVVRGIGGEYLQNADVELFSHYKDIAFMGFWEVITNLSKIRKVLNKCKDDIQSYNPDVIILVDFGGFNLRVAKFAKALGLKVFYYISPKIWAWNQSRAYKIKAVVDKMFVILPFEKDFYKKFDYEVDYVGNPVYDAVTAYEVNPDFKIKHQLTGKKLIAILPGSRKQEVLSMLSLMVSIQSSFKEYHFVIAGVSNLPKDFYDPFVQKGIPVVYNETYDLLLNSEAAIVASGTATLETGLLEVPQAVCYKTSPISYSIAKRLIKVRYISLVNLIADKEVVKELIQDDFSAIGLTKELNRILSDEKYRASIISGYKEVKSILGAPGASEKTAELMVGYLKQQ